MTDSTYSLEELKSYPVNLSYTERLEEIKRLSEALDEIESEWDYPAKEPTSPKRQHDAIRCIERMKQRAREALTPPEGE